MKIRNSIPWKTAKGSKTSFLLRNLLEDAIRKLVERWQKLVKQKTNIFFIKYVLQMIFNLFF